MEGQDTAVMDGDSPVDTVSGDDLPVEESPAGDGEDSGNSAVSPEGPGTAGDGGGQEPGDGVENQGEEDKENKEDEEGGGNLDESPSGPEAGVQGQPVVIIEDGDSKEWREDVTGRLAQLAEPPDDTDVTDRLDALIDILTPEETVEDAGATGFGQYAAVLFDGYAEWDYPVTMQYMVYPYGSGGWLEQTEPCQDADGFLAVCGEIAGQCGEGGAFKDFYVQYVWDCNGGKVYDYETLVPEQEPGPEDGGQGEAASLLLSHLEEVNTVLSGMVQANTDYYGMVENYEAQMLEMQAASTATDIFICIGVFAVFITLVWSQLFGRFK